MTQEQVPVKFLKAITRVAGLYEIRVEEGGNIYRIFCCMDEGRLVILFNGFQMLKLFIYITKMMFISKEEELHFMLIGQDKVGMKQ